MLSNLKVRTLFIVILAVLSLMGAAAAVTGWFAMQRSHDDLTRLRSIAVKQSDDSRIAQVYALRALVRLDAALDQADAAGRRRELEAAQGFMEQSRRHFADYAMEAGKSAGGSAMVARIRPAFETSMASLDKLAGLVVEGAPSRQFQALKVGEAVPAVVAYSSAMEFFRAETDRISSTLSRDAEELMGTMRWVYPAFVVLLLLVSALALVFLSRRVLRPLADAGRQLEQIASGDLTQRVEGHSRNEIGQLLQSLKRMQEGLARMVASVRRSVEEINVGAREISAGNTDLSGRTEEQAASLEETAASMEQLASTVKQNADNARQANQLAASASDVAERGGSAVSEVVGTMEGISASSRKISEIVSVIDGIAFQTNILALNAAVEAARAGEQGKGFAVVAGEVRALAQRSAQAAKEIKVLIEESVSKVEVGSQQVDRAGRTMQEIVQSVKRVTDIMGEISAASQEQAGGIEQVNRAVSQMDEVTQQNAALVEEASAAASSLQEQSQQLQQAVAMFRVNAGTVIDAAAEAGRLAPPQRELSGGDRLALAS